MFVTHSVVPDSLRPHGLQPTRLLCPWDSPGKGTGVGCHFLLHLQTMEYYSAIKTSQLMMHATTWMNPKNMLSERSQIQKITCCLTPFIWCVQQNKSVETENKCVVAWGWGWEWRVAVKRHKSSFRGDGGILGWECGDCTTLSMH